MIERITKSFSKEELKTNYKHHVVDLAKKIREKTKNDSSENRYKIVSSFRSLNESSEASNDNIVNIVDVEDLKSCSDANYDSKKQVRKFIFFCA